jgi:hypothetical protein
MAFEILESARQTKVRQVYYGWVEKLGDEDIGRLDVSVDNLFPVK